MPFDPAAFAQSILSAAAQNGWESDELAPVHDWRRPWFRRHANTPQAPRLYISAGIHGDEPAGCAAALELVRQPEVFRDLNVILIPLLNPTGLAAGTRENTEGIDLNRDYLEPKSEEIRSHLAVLETLGRFDMTLCLHEDWETTGFYFYELNSNDTPGCARQIQDAMAQHLPIEPNALIDGFEATNGIISRNTQFLQIPRPQWAEAFYLAHHHTRLGYTFETPSRAAALEVRAAAQVAGVRAALEFLHAKKIHSPGAPLASLAQ